VKCPPIAFAVIFLLAGFAPSSGQTTPPAASTTPPGLPKWGGCGASFSNPGWLGWCALAIPVVQSQGIYSWTMYQFIPNGSAVPAVVTSTGGAMILRSFAIRKGKLDIIGLGAVGVAVTSTAASFSPSGGGLALWRSAKGWTLEVGAIENKVGSVTKPQWIAGPGITW
jgi:hypothetical protein